MVGQVGLRDTAVGVASTLGLAATGSLPLMGPGRRLEQRAGHTRKSLLEMRVVLQGLVKLQ